MSEPLLYSIPQAATLLSISRATLYELIGAKEIRALKIGRRTAIAAVELQRFVNARIAEAA